MKNLKLTHLPLKIGSCYYVNNIPSEQVIILTRLMIYFQERLDLKRQLRQVHSKRLFFL